MFRKEYLDEFYNKKINSEFEVSIEVKKAYITFLSSFCKYVSSFWSIYMKLDKRNENIKSLGFKSNLTISDEAIAIWLIRHNYDSAYKNAQEITAVGLTVWKQNRVKHKQGQHDTKLHYGDYKKIFSKVKAGRKDEATLKYWESIFFEGHYEFNSTPSEPTETMEEIDGLDETFEDIEVLEI